METENPVFNLNRGVLSNFSSGFHGFGGSVPQPNAVPSNVEGIILSPSVVAAVPAAQMLTSQATRLPLQIIGS